MTGFDDTRSITRGKMSAHSDPSKQIGRGSAAVRSSFSDADQRLVQRQRRQADAARDEYLLNLFRQADQTCGAPQLEHQGSQQWQQNGWAAQGSSAGLQQQNPMRIGQNGHSMGQNGQHGAAGAPAFHLPGYPGHGPLPVNGNPSSAGSQEPHKVDAAGSDGRLSNILDNSEGALDSEKIKAKLGRKAYSAVRRRILEHMEVFVENIYDLHRLTRRQHHLEGICEDKGTYTAELARLVAPASANPLSVQPEPAAAVAAAGAAPSLEKPEQEGVKERKEGDISNERKDISNERKGSNEPIMPVEEILATALSNESLPDLGRQLNMGAPMGSGMGSGRGSEERLDDRMGSLKAISRNMRQASVHDLEEQHQHMAAAQEQMKQSMAAAQQAQAQQQRNMEVAAQAQYQHHQSMAAAYGQGGVPSATPFQAGQEPPRAPAGQKLGPGASHCNADGALPAAGATGLQPQGPHGNADTGGFSVIPDMQPSVQSAMANNTAMANSTAMASNTPDSQAGMQMNKFPTYINPYQSFPNPLSVQDHMSGFGGYGGFNQPFYPGFNCYSNTNGQGYNAYNMLGPGALSFDPMFAWYAHHYGRGAAQAQAQAQAQAEAAQAADDAQAAKEEDAAPAAKAAKARSGPAAQDQPGGRHSRGRNDSQAPAVHWWQDPQAAFGPGDPVANAAAQQRDGGLTNDARKPARPLSEQPGSKHSREHKEWAPQKQRAKRQQHATRDEATGQTSGGKAAVNRSNTFGSGGSAFRKVAQRPCNFRSLQRADSVGSENSRSRSSIGAAPGRRGHTDAASPPEQLQSAANILAGLSGQRQS